MKFYCTLFALFGALTGGATASAQGTGLFLEPGVTYQLTESEIDYGGGIANSTATTRGFGVVLRGGIHVWERFFVAADGRYALLDFQDNANNMSVNATSWDIAPVLGVQMADWGARLYGGYVLAGNLDPRSSGGMDTKFEQVTGWRLGIGLKLQQLGFNVEWQRLHYGDAQLERAGTATPADIKYNPDGLIASLTFPIEFP